MKGVAVCRIHDFSHGSSVGNAIEGLLRRAEVPH